MSGRCAHPIPKRPRSALARSESQNLGPVGGLEDLHDAVKIVSGEHVEVIQSLERLRTGQERAGADVDALYGCHAEVVVRLEAMERAADESEAGIASLGARVDTVSEMLQALDRRVDRIDRAVQLLLSRVPEGPAPTVMPSMGSPTGPFSEGAPGGRVLKGSCEVPICAECGEWCTECTCLDDVAEGHCGGCGGSFDVCRCGQQSLSECPDSQEAMLECDYVGYVPPEEM